MWKCIFILYIMKYLFVLVIIYLHSLFIQRFLVDKMVFNLTFFHYLKYVYSATTGISYIVFCICYRLLINLKIFLYYISSFNVHQSAHLIKTIDIDIFHLYLYCRKISLAAILICIVIGS